jgi:hypothetical protein
MAEQAVMAELGLVLDPQAAALAVAVVQVVTYKSYATMY